MNFFLLPQISFHRIFAVTAFSICVVSASAFGRDIRYAPLTVLPLAKDPWFELPDAGCSEKTRPFYLGATPREMEFGITPERGRLTIPVKLLNLGTQQAQLLRETLKQVQAEFEVWPGYDDFGELSLVFARWRSAPRQPWQWLASDLLEDLSFEMELPILPTSYAPKDPKDWQQLFAPFWQQNSTPGIWDINDLYAEPVASDTVWTKDTDVIAAWLLPRYHPYLKKLARHDGITARRFPQPARFGRQPTTFILRATAESVSWPTGIYWENDAEQLPPPAITEIPHWPTNFKDLYRDDMLVFTGEKPARLASGKKVTFSRLNNGQKDTQLLDMAHYLAEKYRALGLTVEMQYFHWDGRLHANVIAKLKGALPAEKNKPVIMADHYDRAIAEDIYESTGKHISTYGANDNVTATATLLRGVASFTIDKKTGRAVGPSGRELQHDLWFLHLTGEEYPAESLGARHFVAQLLREKKDITGVVLLDMIGFHEPADRIFQINAGGTKKSLYLASTALAAAKQHAPTWSAALRTVHDAHSYLRQTDGEVFDGAGFPVVLFNEHTNMETRDHNTHYHKSSDKVENVDLDYATDIAKAAIATSAALSQTP